MGRLAPGTAAEEGPVNGQILSKLFASHDPACGSFDLNAAHRRNGGITIGPLAHGCPADIDRSSQRSRSSRRLGYVVFEFHAY